MKDEVLASEGNYKNAGLNTFKLPLNVKPSLYFSVSVSNIHYSYYKGCIMKFAEIIL